MDIGMDEDDNLDIDSCHNMLISHDLNHRTWIRHTNPKHEKKSYQKCQDKYNQHISLAWPNLFYMKN